MDGVDPKLVYLTLPSRVVFLSPVPPPGPWGKINRHIQLLSPSACFCGGPQALPPNLDAKPQVALTPVPSAAWLVRDSALALCRGLLLGPVPSLHNIGYLLFTGIGS